MLNASLWVLDGSCLLDAAWWEGGELRRSEVMRLGPGVRSVPPAE